MTLKFGQIRPLVSMVTDRVTMGKKGVATFLGSFYPILFILAGSDDIHKSLDEFAIRPDPIRDHRVSCS